jgi:hypothetical protein
MVFFELRWNYSPLKEEAVLLPDGLFIFMVASRHTAKEFRLSQGISAPDASRSARTGLAAWMWWTKFVATLDTAMDFCLSQENFCSCCKPLGAQIGLAAWMWWTKFVATPDTAMDFCLSQENFCS